MRKRLVRNQDTRVTQKSDGYTVETWHKENPSKPVSKFENPDILTEDQGAFSVTNDVQEVNIRVQKLLNLAKQILTERQYQVFDLVALQYMTIRRVARVLKISPGRVDQLWQSAKHKLQKAYDDRTA